MPVPDFQSFFLPVLRSTTDGENHPLAELRERLATDLALSAEELAQKLPSGVQTVFANRLAWSAVYLTKAGALERVKRGVFRITDRGKDLLALDVPKLMVKDLPKYTEFVTFQKGSQNGGDYEEETKPEKSQTPEEQLANAYKVLRGALANDVLEAVKKSSPIFFEELVVELLVAMGYGGSIEDAGRAVGKSGDGGIDGIIKEDKLGLDVVYVQAKRWSNSVGRPVVQAFAGSLEGVRARKGVLITTSYFSQDALEYVRMIEKRIVLIDGRQLADLMIDHDIGVNVAQTYKVKRLDSDYLKVPEPDCMKTTVEPIDTMTTTISGVN
jgi:restriction system protein